MKSGVEALTTRYPTKGLDELCESGLIKLGRGLVISKNDIAACPGQYPIYSSAKENEGKFGEYGRFMFDEEMLTWSVDGGGRFFHRKKHKFSVTNVGGTLRISDTDRLDYRFLYFMITYLQGMIPFDWVLKAHPSVIRKLYRQIPIPPLDEQRRIVAVLDKAFANIATATANTQQNLTNARALFETGLENAFSGDEFGWITKPFSELCTIKHGFAFKSEFFGTDGEYVLLTPGNFYETGGYRDRGAKQKFYSGEVPPDFILDEGDLLVAMTEQADGLLGSPIVVPTGATFLHNQRLGLVEPKSGVAWFAEFFFHAFNTQAVRLTLRRTGTGAKVRHTSPTKIGEVEISFPKTELQQRQVAAKLTAFEFRSMELANVVNRKLAALTELKQSLLQKAFAGELT